MTQTDISSLDAAALAARVERFRSVRGEILAQVQQVIVGQDEGLDQILTALLVGGHCLITGLPGTAKTLMVRTIAQTLGLAFSRIQFTPDLMPADITGTDIIEDDETTGRRRWSFSPGPLFGNIVLADEINRTPPKTAVGAARGDAGALVHRTRHDPPASKPVLRIGDPEPH